jgi:hypothetical protein
MQEILDHLDRQLQAARQIPMEGFHRVTNPRDGRPVFWVGNFLVIDTRRNDFWGTVTQTIENRLRSETSGVLDPG